jgi:hypothetical protein
MADYTLPYPLLDDMSEPRPSSVRVLHRSLHLLAIGWLVSVGWLWIAQVQLNQLRFGVPPDGYGMRTLIEGIFPAALLELMAIWLGSAIGRVSRSSDPKREWLHAFWWTLVPNLLVLGTAYLMILEAN